MQYSQSDRRKHFCSGSSVDSEEDGSQKLGFRESWPVPQRERLTNVGRVSWSRGPRVKAGSGKTIRTGGRCPAECGPKALSG